MDLNPSVRLPIKPDTYFLTNNKLIKIIALRAQFSWSCSPPTQSPI
jgi:hypothetical protein